MNHLAYRANTHAHSQATALTGPLKWSAIIETIETSFWPDIIRKLECAPMPNVMVALPNVGGALCSTPQSLADAHY